MGEENIPIWTLGEPQNPPRHKSINKSSGFILLVRLALLKE
jgi:hypothetical protein